MSTETIFFSYSRTDTEFVLSLAKNLRSAGANIWLDQLDIKPGTRWDSSIEKALDSSKTLLVILSNTSVASHNVMDEVSYALGENKKVVPVLLEECTIPFRLKRLQYADFTSDHQKGLKTLAEALNLDQVVAEKLTEATPENAFKPEKKAVSVEKKPIQKQGVKERVEQQHVDDQQKQEPGRIQEKIPTASDPSRTVSSTNSKNRLPLYIGGGLVLLLGILWMSGVFGTDTNTEMPKDVIVPEVAEQLDSDEASDVEENVNNDNDDVPEPEKTNNDAVTSGSVKKANQDSKTSKPEPNNPEPEPIIPEPIVVNGQNVTIVQYTDGQVDPAGYFRQVGPNKWEEESLIHGHLTPFEEVMRDDWSVYLSDRSRDVTIQLDLHTRKVNLNYDKPDTGMLYTISDAQSGQ